tara:strand:+ start:196 stop:324 length:129 start_codon:yes stop_codon:yes gene_type:complete
MKLLITKSLNHRIKTGRKKARVLFSKYFPPNKEIAIIGVKFG